MSWSGSGTSILCFFRRWQPPSEINCSACSWVKPMDKLESPRGINFGSIESELTNGFRVGQNPASCANMEARMHFVLGRRNVVVGILAAATFGLLLSNVLSSSDSARKTSAAGVEITISPFAMMMKAPLHLPVEQYDGY
jgi:hypothetical protein